MIPKVIFSDFDGTLTRGLHFSEDFLKILELARKHDIPFVVVTGRSLSWGHFFLTHFESLSHVIVEGGGIVTYQGDDGQIHEKLFVDQEHIKKIEVFSEKLINEYKVELSADSFGRKFDRAIELDFLKNDPKLHEEIVRLMEEENIGSSTSSVHLNFWSGDTSKFTSVQNFLTTFFPEVTSSECLYFGDALNDESAFCGFKHSVGVSNIQEHLKSMKHHPSVILEGDENEGAEGVLRYLESLLK